MIGHAIDAPLPASGGWNLSRIADLTLAQAAYQLANEKRIWLPTMNKTACVAVPMTTVGAIGQIGPYHADISGDNAKGAARGPFSISDIKQNSAPTYPVLWSHDAAHQRTMAFDATNEGVPRVGSSPKEQADIDRKVTEVWASASHCHSSREFRFNSQSTSMQFAPRKSVGGRAWLSISLASEEEEKALVLWSNTSLGALLYWWHTNKQQSGRGAIGKSTLDSLPILDVMALTPKQLKRAVEIFDLVSGKDMLPLNEMEHDPVRREIDAVFAHEVLGVDAQLLTSNGPFDLLRMKLAREPSIRGQK